MLSFFFRMDLGSLMFIWFCIDWMIAAFFVFAIELGRPEKRVAHRRPLGLIPEAQPAL
jgi:hypothetical protein